MCDNDFFEIEDSSDSDFLNPDSFDRNWFDKIDADEAKKVVSSANIIGTFEEDGSICWTVYKLKEKYYIGLSDFEDIWESNKEEIEKYL